MSGNVPSIRFSGFTDPWEQRKAGEIFTIYDDRNHADLPVLSASQGEGMVLRDEMGRNISYDHSNEKNYKRVKPGSFVIHLRSFQGGFAHSPIEGIVSPAYTVFEAIDETNQCDRFWKHLFMSKRFVQALTIVTYGIRDGRSINVDEFLEMPLSYPAYPEQVDIGQTIDRLDNLITLHQRECDRLEKVRASLMQSMFPQPGETLPSIRFAEFTKPWHSKQLGSLVTPFDHRIPTPTDGYVRLGVRSFAKGTFLQDVPAEQAIGETELREVGPNNLIVNIVFAWEQAIAITSEADTIALVSHRFPQFSFNDGQCPDFYRYALLDPRFRHHLWLASPSGAGRNKTLRVDEMLEYWILVPSFEEQRAIADFFAAFDRSLDARRRLCEALGHVKNALLSSMFV